MCSLNENCFGVFWKMKSLKGQCHLQKISDPLQIEEKKNFDGFSCGKKAILNPDDLEDGLNQNIWNETNVALNKDTLASSLFKNRERCAEIL